MNIYACLLPKIISLMDFTIVIYIVMQMFFYFNQTTDKLLILFAGCFGIVAETQDW